MDPQVGQSKFSRKGKYIFSLKGNSALKGPCGFLVKAELERNPGNAAWHHLAREFCEKLAEHIDEFMEEGEDVARETCEIFMAYEDGDSDLYSILPVEAQLFEKE